MVWKMDKCKRTSLGPLLQEEAIEIAKELEKEELTDFTASNAWL